MSAPAGIAAKLLRGLSYLMALGSMLLYVASLKLPAFSTVGGPTGREYWTGLYALIHGLPTALSGTPAWWANPLVWLAGFCLSCSKHYAAHYAALGLAALSLGAALSIWATKRVRLLIFADSHIDLEVGYLVWVASIVLALLAVAFAIAHRKYCESVA